MQRTSIFETLLSALVVVVAVGFLGFATWQTGTGSLKSYVIDARIRGADGIKTGTDVKVAGVKVGTVDDLSLDPRHYSVALKLSIREDIHIPEDSTLSIGGGLLSSAALIVTPGHSATMVAPGGTLKVR